jgi:hypothetical protein
VTKSFSRSGGGAAAVVVITGDPVVASLLLLFLVPKALALKALVLHPIGVRK